MRLKETTRRRRSVNNPWQILVIAFLFFLPGVLLLLTTEPSVVVHQSYRWVHNTTLEIASPKMLHIFGIIALAISGLIVLFYFWLRKEIERDERMPNRKQYR